MYNLHLIEPWRIVKRSEKSSDSLLEFFFTLHCGLLELCHLYWISCQSGVFEASSGETLDLIEILRPDDETLFFYYSCLFLLNRLLRGMLHKTAWQPTECQDWAGCYIIVKRKDLKQHSNAAIALPAIGLRHWVCATSATVYVYSPSAPNKQQQITSLGWLY